MEQAEPVTKPVSRWAKLRRALRWLMIATAVAAVCGLAWTHYSYQRFCAAYPPPGELVNVDGIDFHVVVRGEPQPGEPTVVIDACLGGGATDVLDFVEQCQSFCRILVMDRRGHGYSSGLPHSAVSPAQNVKDLRAVLQAQEIEPPYVFVGHSMGGLTARIYEQEYPDEVAGLMLVDSVAPPVDLEKSESSLSPLVYPLAYSGLFGLPQALEFAMDSQQEIMPPRLAARLLGEQRSPYYLISLVHHAEGLLGSVEQYAPTMAAQCRVPVTVIAAKGPPGDEHEWRQSQQSFRSMSDSVKFIDLDCDHLVFWVEPQLCVDELRDLLMRVRESHRGDSSKG